ncbi:hypothetical protein [Sphingomonas sp. 3-13AW]|uniref:hypothetical protein n=1 Tax=Sphingomonas sp. 3-13AW TaxID=3050450 RepID=UPI003BB57724
MKKYDRDYAMLIARTVRQTVDFHRWRQNLAEWNALLGLERALSVSVQIGQSKIEAMQDGLIATYASQLVSLAQAAYQAGRIADVTMNEEQLFASERTRVLDVIDVRQAASEIVDVSYLRRSAESLAA